MDYLNQFLQVGPFGGMGQFNPGPFRVELRCASTAFLGKTEAEVGGKIFLPPSALERLSHMEVQYPMLFRISNIKQEFNLQRATYAGVLEFTADEGHCFLPNWMMESLFLKDGEIVRIENVDLPLATYAKFQPQSTEFLDISNPRAVLEKALRQYSCLTEGEIFRFHYNKKEYEILVQEVKPKSPKKAVCIVECDMQLDFSAPKGYVEPQKPKQVLPPIIHKKNEGPEALFIPTPSNSVSTEPEPSFKGAAYRPDGKHDVKQTPSTSSSTASSSKLPHNVTQFKFGKLAFREGAPLLIPVPMSDEGTSDPFGGGAKTLRGGQPSSSK